MKKIIYIFLLLSFLGCKKTSQKIINKKNHSKDSLNKEPKKITKGVIDLGDFVLYVANADTEDFKVSFSKNTDTIVIKKNLYINLDGAILKTVDGVDFNKIEEQLVFSFKQSTIDEKPAFPLDINFYKTNIVQNIKSYKLTATSDNKEWLETTYFDEVKAKSIQYQLNFYTNLLNDKKRYISCCPEYIEQANSFIDNKNKLFNNFDELRVYPYIKKRFIKITYIKEQKNQVKYIIYYSFSA